MWKVGFALIGISAFIALFSHFYYENQKNIKIFTEKCVKDGGEVPPNLKNILCIKTGSLIRVMRD